MSQSATRKGAPCPRNAASAGPFFPSGSQRPLVLAGCTPTELHGYLPGFVEDGTPTTNRTDMVAGLWVNSWIVLLVVGVITWGLMGWAAIAYRRRKGQVGLPVQLRYNMPIEIFYTIVPLILVLGFFAFTARDQTILETQTEDPDVSIVAIGKQWAWDFQYNGEDEDGADAVWSMGVQAQPAANGDVDQEELPTLVPAGRQVGEDPAAVARCHPLVLDHRLPVQEGHVHRARQLLVVHADP